MIELDERGYTALLPELSERDYERLKDDIARRGIQVPIEFTEDGVLIDGWHRLRAARELGIRDYPRLVRKLPPDQIVDHVLALHVHRRHLSKQARNQLALTLAAQGRSIRAIAEATGVPRATVARILRSTGVPNETPVTGRDGKTYPRRSGPAVPASSTQQQRRAERALQAAGDRAPDRLIDLTKIERLAREKAHQERQTLQRPHHVGDITIVHSDFRDLHIVPGSASAIITDPPYTVEDMRTGIWADLGHKAQEWLQPGGVLAAYTPIAFLPQALADLTSAGLEYYWMNAVIHQGPLSQVTVRNVGNSWKPVVLFRTPGGRRKLPWIRDVITTGARSKDHNHPWEQSVDEAIELIQALTSPGDLVVDPFLGSGTVAVAAIRTGRRLTGSELDPGHAHTAAERVTSETASSPAGAARSTAGR